MVNCSRGWVDGGGGREGQVELKSSAAQGYLGTPYLRHGESNGEFDSETWGTRKTARMHSQMPGTDEPRSFRCR